MSDGPATHDYTRRYAGHDYTFEPIDNGQRGRVVGWGKGIRAGDYLLLQREAGAGPGSTRYQIVDVRYYSDPSDMWSASVRFAPRPLVAGEGGGR